MPALHQDGALGIGNDVGAVHLHQIRLEPEAGLAGTAAADDQNVLVAGILGVLGTAGHGKPLGLGQNDVILEHRVDVGGNILMGAPSGRTILHVVAVIFWRSCLSDTPPAAGQRRSKAPPANPAGAGWATSSPAPPAGWRRMRASWQTHPRRSPAARLPQVGCEQAQQEVGQVQQNQLFDIQLLHRSSSFRRLRSTTVFLSSSLNWASFASTEGRSLRSAFLTFFWVYSEKAAVSASASRPLKKIRYLGGEALRSLFHRIVHAVLAGDALKILDGRVVDLDVGDALVSAR